MIANLYQSPNRLGAWVCSLDLDWWDSTDLIGYIEVFGPTRRDAARAMVAFLHTIGARQEVWILDEEERAYATYKWGRSHRPVVRLHVRDWNRGGGKTAWSEEGAA